MTEATGTEQRAECANCSDTIFLSVGAWFHLQTGGPNCVVAQTKATPRRSLMSDELISRAEAGRSVYVLVALDEDTRVRECVVLTDSRQASELFQKLRSIWGGANVAMASRKVDDLPPNLHEKISAVTEIIQ